MPSKKLTLDRNHLQQNLNHQVMPFNTIAEQLINYPCTNLEDLTEIYQEVESLCNTMCRKKQPQKGLCH